MKFLKHFSPLFFKGKLVVKHQFERSGEEAFILLEEKVSEVIDPVIVPSFDGDFKLKFFLYDRFGTEHGSLIVHFWNDYGETISIYGHGSASDFLVVWELSRSLE